MIPLKTIAPQKDNPARREFEIGQLGNDDLKENEITRDETGNGAPGYTKLPNENFNALIDPGPGILPAYTSNKKAIFLTNNETKTSQ